LKQGTIGHVSSVLILEELDYEPFTENRQWPGGKRKIARPCTPATLFARFAVEFMLAGSGRGISACHNILI
jgi:hypothetical protein